MVKKVDEPILFFPARKLLLPYLCFLFKHMCELQILTRCALGLRVEFLGLSLHYCGYVLCTTSVVTAMPPKDRTDCTCGALLVFACEQV